MLKIIKNFTKKYTLSTKFFINLEENKNGHLKKSHIIKFLNIDNELITELLLFLNVDIFKIENFLFYCDEYTYFAIKLNGDNIELLSISKYKIIKNSVRTYLVYSYNIEDDKLSLIYQNDKTGWSFYDKIDIHENIKLIEYFHEYQCYAYLKNNFKDKLPLINMIYSDEQNLSIYLEIK